MKILFDQGVPKPLQAFLSDHEVRRAFQLGWANKKNGELLALAEAAGFEVLVALQTILPVATALPRGPRRDLEPPLRSGAYLR